MTGVHIHIEQQQIVVRFQRPESGHHLGRLPISHLLIGNTRVEQHGRVVNSLHIIVRRVRQDVVVIIDTGQWVTPLLPFRRRQWQRGITDGVNDIDKRHISHHAAKQVRSQVGDCPHKQTAGTATIDGDALLSRVALLNKVLSDINKVVKGIHFVAHFAIQIPAIALFITATNMRRSVDKATIDQTEQLG